MRSFNVKILGCIGLLAALAIILGCGSGNDLLDTTAFQYSASIVPQDGEEKTWDIDVVQAACDATTAEDFFDMAAVATVETDSTAPDLRINSYVVQVTPKQGVYSQDLGATWISFSPPTLSSALTSLTYLDDTVVLNSGGTLEFDALIWTAGQKRLYLSEIQAALSNNSTYAQFARTQYNVHVTFYATTIENDDDITMDADMTIYLTNVNRCSAAE